MGLEPGDTRTTNVIVRDQKGNLMPDAEIVWQSSAAAVAQVDGNGKITAVADGEADITATVGMGAESKIATVKVTVAQRVVESISLSGPDWCYAGYTIQLQALVKDQFGQNYTDAAISWSSSAPETASVSAQGVVYGIKPGVSTITAVAGGKTATLQVQIKEYKQRYVEITYVRDNHDYAGWSLWLWNTGTSSDGDKTFDKVLPDKAVARFPVGAMTDSVGMVLHKTVAGDPWAEKDDYDKDRYIPLDLEESLIKLTVYQGKKDFAIKPSLHGAEIISGVAHYYFRDPELYSDGTLSQLQAVTVHVRKTDAEGNYLGQVRAMIMEYSVENEYWYAQDTEIEEGYYEYEFLVTPQAGTPYTVPDPYNKPGNKSKLIYHIPDIKLAASVYPSQIYAGESAVVSLKITDPENAGIREITIDTSAIGGPDKVSMSSELLLQTVSAAPQLEAGKKSLPLVLTDEFGNRHTTELSLEIAEFNSAATDADEWQEEIIYFLLTDRFANGDSSNDDPNGENYNINDKESYHGGDFQGIIDKMPYLRDLGVSTIWITPIVDNINWNLRHDKDGSQYGYHGYWAKDFTKLDEHLGDLGTFHRLIDTAHDHGIKIMVDVVLNHVGYGLKEGESSSVPNFPTSAEQQQWAEYIRKNPVANHEVLGELAGLPDLRTEDPLVREQIVKWQVDWLTRSRTARGDQIDYFRVDTVKHVDHETWITFKNELTRQDPSFKLIGEYFSGSADNQGGYLGTGQMDSLLDFTFKNIAQQFVNGNLAAAEDSLVARNQKVDSHHMLGQFLSSHDESGFLKIALGGDKDKFKLATALQLTAIGQPVIYYGEEIGLEHGKPAGNMDNGEFSENREDFPWAGDNLAAGADQDLLQHYKKLIAIRKDFREILAYGDRETIAADDAKGYVITKRTAPGSADSIYLGFNVRSFAQEQSFTTIWDEGTTVVEQYSGTEYVVAADKKLTVTIPAMQDGGFVALTAVAELPAVIRYVKAEDVPAVAPAGYTRVVFSVTAAASLQYNPSFAPGVPVTFDVKSGTTWREAMAAESGLVLPTVTPIDSDYEFVGWSPALPGLDEEVSAIEFEAKLALKKPTPTSIPTAMPVSTTTDDSAVTEATISTTTNGATTVKGTHATTTNDATRAKGTHATTTNDAATAKGTYATTTNDPTVSKLTTIKPVDLTSSAGVAAITPATTSSVNTSGGQRNVSGDDFAPITGEEAVPQVWATFALAAAGLLLILRKKIKSE